MNSSKTAAPSMRMYQVTSFGRETIDIYAEGVDAAMRGYRTAVFGLGEGDTIIVRCLYGNDTRGVTYTWIPGEGFTARS